MADSAKGPLAGYLYQFEKALLILSSLEKSTDIVTIEEVDDVGVHDNSGVIIMAVQAKHSISPSGTTFEDTSYSLWRTFEIWINKIKDSTFSDKTKFVCSTNKKIPTQSLLYQIKNSKSFEEAILKIQNLVNDQQEKLKNIKSKGTTS